MPCRFTNCAVSPRERALLREEFATILATNIAATGRRLRPLQVRVMTQMVYWLLLAGVLDKRAPTRISDTETIEELVRACNACLLEG